MRPCVGIQELLCGAEAERGQPLRFDQILQCALNRLVIIEDCQKAWSVLDLHGQKVTLSIKAAQSDRGRKNYYSGGSRLEVEEDG